MSTPARTIHYCFTHQLDEKDETPLNFNEEKMRYLVYQREIAPTTGKHHYQAYVQFKTPRTFTGALRILPKGVHLEAAKGSPEQARDYCKKDSTRANGYQTVEHGVFSSQGRRMDINALVEDAKAGKSNLELLVNHTSAYAKYYKFIDRIRADMLQERVKATPYRKISCKVYYGPSGTGKTYRVWDRHSFDISKLYAVPNIRSQGTIWFDGYDGQDSILFDDYNGQLPLQSFITYLDPYPKILPVKGSHMPAVYTKVYITSNFHPNEWYPDATEKEQRALLRRLNIQYIDSNVPVWARPDPPGNGLPQASGDSKSNEPEPQKERGFGNFSKVSKDYFIDITEDSDG